MIIDVPLVLSRHTIITIIKTKNYISYTHAPPKKPYKNKDAAQHPL